MEYWIINADSLFHQVFMIVMGGLYGLAYLLGVSYKAVNIYFYFIFFPLSFMFLQKGWKQYLFLPVSLVFFLLPDYEELSQRFFELSVGFLNYSAGVFGSDYIRMSVYLCVLLPLILYSGLVYLKWGKPGILRLVKFGGGGIVIYLLLVYPNMQSWLAHLKDYLL